jgi:hypothetical protein
MKNMITHLLLVQFGPFQRRSLVFYRLSAVETREDVVGTITGGEQAWRRVGDGRAIFFDVAGGGGCQEGSSGWMDGIGTLYNAFGCWEEDAKGLGSIGYV